MSVSSIISNAATGFRPPTLSVRPLSGPPTGGSGDAAIATGGRSIPDGRLLQAASEARQARIITDVVDLSIQRSQEARAERQEREQDEAAIARRDARRAEQDESAARADRKQAELERAQSERDATRETALAELGARIDVFA